MYLINEIISIYENPELKSILERNHIEVLKGFKENIKYIELFYNTFYSNSFPKIVICGINPGRFGAGKTGIPFMDFDTLTEIFPELNKNGETERSSQFMKSLMHLFNGYNNFFDKFYLTNYSFLGFVRESRNQNYYTLPVNAQKLISQNFLNEMNIIKPNYIIALSVDVFNDIKNINLNKDINVLRLPHPFFCSFPSLRPEYLAKYFNTLKKISTNFY